MRKLFFVMMVLLLINTHFVSAQEHDFAETKQLIDSGMSCDKLTDEQLEAIGDYYMEQMHPGEAHEIMDNLMGGEGSASLKQVHIAMARRLYCNDNLYVGYGMMGRGMMGNYPIGYGNYGYTSYGYWNIVLTLFFAGIFFLIGWLIYRVGIQRTADPLSILKKRLASGEITKKEFEEKKKDLT